VGKDRGGAKQTAAATGQLGQLRLPDLAARWFLLVPVKVRTEGRQERGAILYLQHPSPGCSLLGCSRKKRKTSALGAACLSKNHFLLLQGRIMPVSRA